MTSLQPCFAEPAERLECRCQPRNLPCRLWWYFGENAGDLHATGTCIQSLILLLLLQKSSVMLVLLQRFHASIASTVAHRLLLLSFFALP